MVKLYKWTAASTIEVRIAMQSVLTYFFSPGRRAEFLRPVSIARSASSVFSVLSVSDAFYSCVEITMDKGIEALAHDKTDFGGNRPVFGVFQLKSKTPLTFTTTGIQSSMEFYETPKMIVYDCVLILMLSSRFTRNVLFSVLH